MSDELAALFIEAAGDGVQTSISDLIKILDLQNDPPLSAAQSAVDYFSNYGLVLSPEFPDGELTTPRRLYKPTPAEQRASTVLSLVAQGETASCEFKQSLFADMKRLKATSSLHAHPALEGECLKSVAAFLNSGGGHLLVGVRDDGSVCDGIARDLELKQWNVDTWQLHWETIVKQRFWRASEIRTHVDSAMVNIDGHLVFHVAVTNCARPAFVQRGAQLEFEFFVRRGPSTHSLSLPEFADHIAG